MAISFKIGDTVKVQLTQERVWAEVKEIKKDTFNAKLLNNPVINPQGWGDLCSFNNEYEFEEVLEKYAGELVINDNSFSLCIDHLTELEKYPNTTELEVFGINECSFNICKNSGRSREFIIKK